MKIWGMWLMPGGYDITGEAISHGCICIGWGTPRYQGKSDQELLASLMHRYRNEKKPKYVAEQMLTFLRRMKPHDLVLLPRHSHTARRQRDDCYVAKIRLTDDGKEIDRRQFLGLGQLYCRPIELLNFESPWKKSSFPRALRKALQSRNTVWPLMKVTQTVESRLSVPPPSRKDEVVPRPRKPSDQFNHLKRAIHYLLEGGEKKKIRRHQHYQVRLKRLLDLHGATTRVLEEDYVDVKFNWKGRAFIGEIKVTTEHVGPNAAFRAALGQILEYEHLKAAGRSAQMIIFLDKPVDNQRTELASKLGIAVVAESQAGRYHLLGGPFEARSRLGSLFPD